MCEFRHQSLTLKYIEIGLFRYHLACPVSENIKLFSHVSTIFLNFLCLYKGCYIASLGFSLSSSRQNPACRGDWWKGKKQETKERKEKITK